ncbi:MAG: cbb3-type cytochrome oxidase assembly protein CcoS [Desulforhabdus sp.]|jgi:cbb3-type cytochrome oxidase maturation protein|nr:cbb3-type cytochrome oxidase assembly protein CcoS [Desulforhabdus sp.]
MYYSAWIVLVIISLTVSLVAFVWALYSGQFSDQSRARYIPLGSEPALPPIGKPERRALELYALIFIGILGLCGISASIILSLYWM